MGCSSEMGCLGPKPREREVYLDLIEGIYRQVEQMNLPPQQDSYDFIKIGLTKKGLLRKLTDNLKSHKSNIYDCVNQNFQISSQSKLSQIRVASLIVVDKIMEELFKLQKNCEDSGINDKYSPEIQVTLSKPLSTISNSHSWNHTDYREVDHRIDIIFFKAITFLLENQKQLELRIIHSITQFCKHKQDAIAIKTEIYILLDFLFRKMHKKNDFGSAFKAFEMLLRRLKENVKDQQKDMKYIKYFMDVGSKEQGVSEEITLVCQQIIKIYLSKYFNDYLIIYKLMVQLFDQYSFDGNQIWNIWQLMVKISRQIDNYSNFMRGIFIFVLRYIMAYEHLSSHTRLTYKLDEFNLKDYKNVYKQQCKLNAFKMITLWITEKYIDIDESIFYSSALIVMTYVTNYVASTSQLMKQALKKQFYKIISLLNAKSNEIIIDLLIEEIKDRQTPNKKRKMILVVIREIISLKKLFVSPQNIENYNIFIYLQHYYSLDFKLQILNFTKSILKSIKSQYANGASYDPSQLRQKLCDFLYSVYNCIASDQERYEQTETYIKTHLFRKSKNVQELNSSKVVMLEMNKFTSQLNSIIKILLQQHFYIIVVAFIQNINDVMQNLSETADDEQAYILIYFIQLIKRHALFSINKRQKLPQEMFKLHLKLQQGHISNAIRSDAIALSKRLIKQSEKETFQEENEAVRNGEDLRSQIRILMRSDYKRISAAKQFYMFNQLQYAQVMQTFRQHFRCGSSKSAIKKEGGQTLSEIKLFHRNSSINMSRQDLERQQQSVRLEADESFRDIITKINQR